MERVRQVTNTERTVTRFLLFPKILNGEKRWLKFSRIIQKWRCYHTPFNVWTDFGGPDGDWEDFGWAD